MRPYNKMARAACVSRLSPRTQACGGAGAGAISFPLAGTPFQSAPFRPLVFVPSGGVVAVPPLLVTSAISHGGRQSKRDRHPSLSQVSQTVIDNRRPAAHGARAAVKVGTQTLKTP